MSISEPIANAVRTGKCMVGTRSSIDALRKGTAKLLVIANNCPTDEYNDIVRYAQLTGTKIVKFDGTSWELGSTIGKPFMVSAIAVIDPGDSNILKLV